MSGPAKNLGDVLTDRSLAVVAGSGGVGKTTVSAALGLAASEVLDGDTLVLTIDPARRLAAALGLTIDGNDAVEITPVDDGRERAGRTFAAMLDPGPAWDAMVMADASAETAERILANPVYRRIADTFVHGNDYAALGWLDEAINSDRFRLIIVDTPPSQNALDFFDAPQRVEEFFGSSLLNWLTGGDGTLVGGAAAKTFAGLADRLLGAEFFSDVVEFFQLMGEVVPGMVSRTASVAADLAGDDAAFIAVAAPASDVVDRLDRLAEQLATRDLTFDGVVINGAEPDVFAAPKVIDVTERVLARERLPVTAAAAEILTPGAEYVRERSEVAQAQRALLETIPAETTTTVPRFVLSPTTGIELANLGRRLWFGRDVADRDGATP